MIILVKLALALKIIIALLAEILMRLPLMEFVGRRKKSRNWNVKKVNMQLQMSVRNVMNLAKPA